MIVLFLNFKNELKLHYNGLHGGNNDYYLPGTLKNYLLSLINDHDTQMEVDAYPITDSSANAFMKRLSTMDIGKDLANELLSLLSKKVTTMNYSNKYVSQIDFGHIDPSDNEKRNFIISWCLNIGFLIRTNKEEQGSGILKVASFAAWEAIK